MSNTVWLAQLIGLKFTPAYGLEASYPGYYDAKQFIDLKIKNDSRNIDEHEKETYGKLLNKSTELNKKIFSGEYIETSMMPSKVYQHPNEKLPTEDDVIFQFPNGFLLVNATVHNIFNKHKLGKTHFSEVFIYDHRTDEKLIETPYYFMNLAEARNFLNIADSKGIRGSMYEPESLDRFISEPKDNDIILNNEAKDCDVAIWHDTQLMKSIFIKDSIVKELAKAGISKKKFGIVSCQ